MTDFSFQLYSARNFPPLEANLKLIAGLGYTQVEAYSGLFGDPAGLAKMVADNGLTMPTAHIGMDLLKDTQKAIDIAGSLGIKTVFCPAIPRDQRSQGQNSWVELAETLAKMTEAFNAAGLDLGWHNHDFEFVPTSSGKLPMNIILDFAPSLVWEVDVAWLVKGKQSPAAWFDKYGARVAAIHVKDIAPAGEALSEDGWADVGYGVLDWQLLYTEINTLTKAKYFVMEHDNPSDVERFARRSLASARKWK